MLQITHPILKTFPPFLDTSKVLHFESLQMFLPSTFNILNPNHPTLLLIPIFPLHLYISPPPNLIIHLSINQRSRQLRRQFIPADDEGRVGFEEPIDVFEAAVGGFRVEEVGYWDEGEADHGLVSVSLGVWDGKEGMEWGEMGDYPNDPEFVAHVFDSGEGCLDYGVVLGGDGMLDWSFVRVVYSADQRYLFGVIGRYLRKSNWLPWLDWRLQSISLESACLR